MATALRHSPTILIDDRQWKALRKIAASSARGDISELLRGAERGERVVITRNGKPVVAVVPLTDLAALLHDDSKIEQGMVAKIGSRAASTDENTIDFDELVAGPAVSKPREKIDGLQLLAQDHRSIENLFGEFEQARGAATKQRIVRRLCVELKIHMQIEEEIFYPAMRGKVDNDDLDEAYVEHDSVKLLVNELDAASPDEDFYDAKVAVLKELVEHHVREEEKQRNNLFQQTRASDIDLEEVGARLAERKAELMAEMTQQGFAPAELATLHHERSFSAT